MNNDWIKDLKAGDTVIVRGRWREEIETIDIITPTGRIKIRNTYYTQQGRSRGDGK